MDLGGLFLGFLHTVGLGSVTVLILIGVVRLRISRRPAALLPGKRSR